MRSVIPEYNNGRQQDAREFWARWQEQLGRVPENAEPSVAWARWLAERDLHTVTYTSCDHCETVMDNHPEAGARALAPERAVMADVAPGPELASVAAAVRQAFGPVALRGRRCDPARGGCGEVGGHKVIKCRTLPTVLVVCLARYRRTSRGPERVSTPVRRVGDDVDFAEHLDALSAAAGGGPAKAGYRTKDPPSTRYRPRAVVCHKGATTRTGHYTCWVRTETGSGEQGEDAWVIYDDAVIGPPQATLPPNVHTEAYLVFYEQRPHSAEGRGPAACERSGRADHDTDADLLVVDPRRSEVDESMEEVRMMMEGEGAESDGGPRAGHGDVGSGDDRTHAS